MKEEKAVGYTVCVSSNKKDWVKTAIIQARTIYTYCLSNNINLIGMYFDSAYYDFEIKGNAIEQIASLIRSRRINKVVCTNYDKLNFDYFNYSDFRGLLKAKKAELIIINKGFKKNAEYLDFIRKMDSSWDEFQATKKEQKQ